MAICNGCGFEITSHDDHDHSGCSTGHVERAVFERVVCEKIADGWMTDVNARKKLADVIEKARAGARDKALDDAANLVEDMRPAGGAWVSLEAAAKGIRTLKGRKTP